MISRILTVIIGGLVLSSCDGQTTDYRGYALISEFPPSVFFSEKKNTSVVIEQESISKFPKSDSHGDCIYNVFKVRFRGRTVNMNEISVDEILSLNKISPRERDELIRDIKSAAIDHKSICE